MLNIYIIGNGIHSIKQAYNLKTVFLAEIQAVTENYTFLFTL